MLLARVITALILAPLVVWLVLAAPAPYFALAVAAIFNLAVYEWGGLLKDRVSVFERVLYCGLFSVVTGAAYFLPATHQVLLVVGCVIWALAVVAVLIYPRSQAWVSKSWVLFPLGILLPLVAWVGAVTLKDIELGSWWILWILVLVWAADIGAYFAGRFLGKRKLAPQVSPGKTWEGVAGGFVLAGLVCGGGLIWLQAPLQLWIVLMFFLIGLSVFGDLFESALKRASGMKDSGSILPGHGGMLDRIDSLLAVLPVLGFVMAVEA